MSAALINVGESLKHQTEFIDEQAASKPLDKHLYRAKRMQKGADPSGDALLLRLLRIICQRATRFPGHSTTGIIDPVSPAVRLRASGTQALTAVGRTA